MVSAVSKRHVAIRKLASANLGGTMKSIAAAEFLICIAITTALLSPRTVEAQTYGQGIPNLTIDSAQLLSSVTFGKTRFRQGDCALSPEEGPNIGNGFSPIPNPLRGGIRRDLMRFDVSIQNYADTDFAAGPLDVLPWYYASCHRHYHLDFLRYELLDANATTVLIRHVQPVFCF